MIIKEQDIKEVAIHDVQETETGQATCFVKVKSFNKEGLPQSSWHSNSDKIEQVISAQIIGACIWVDQSSVDYDNDERSNCSRYTLETR